MNYPSRNTPVRRRDTPHDMTLWFAQLPTPPYQQGWDDKHEVHQFPLSKDSIVPEHGNLLHGHTMRKASVPAGMETADKQQKQHWQLL